MTEQEYHGVEVINITEEITDWLVHFYGVADGTVWFRDRQWIYFAKQSDHLMFIMRWG